jgi:hypothetical protein
MTKPFSMKQNEVNSVALTPARPPMSEPDITSEAVLSNTLESLSRRMGLNGPQVVADRLRQGDFIAWSDFHYDLARHVAEQLGGLDESVKAAYVDEYDVTPEDAFFGETTRTTVIYLIVWVQCKTDALNSLAITLDRALVQSYSDLIGVPPLTHLLEVQVIDDADAKNPVGYGAWLFSDHFPLTEVWRREGADLELN